MSSNCSTSNVENSVSAQNVIDEATSDGRERSTKEVYGSSSTNVDHPRGLEVAVVESVVGDGVEDSVQDSHRVSCSSVAVAMKEESTILNGLNNVVGGGSKLGGKLVVALSTSGKIASKASRSTSNSGCKVGISTEMSTNIDSFNRSRVRGV